MGKKSSRVGVEGKRRSPTKPSSAPAARDVIVLGGESRPAQPSRDARLGKKVIEKGKRGFVIRDSFTMPVGDYELIGALQQRCLELGIAMKKSELLRAGLATLHGLSDQSLMQVAAAIENVKTGRPPVEKKKAKKNRTKGRKQ